MLNTLRYAVSQLAIDLLFSGLRRGNLYSDNYHNTNKAMMYTRTMGGTGMANSEKVGGAYDELNYAFVHIHVLKEFFLVPFLFWFFYGYRGNLRM